MLVAVSSFSTGCNLPGAAVVDPAPHRQNRQTSQRQIEATEAPFKAWVGSNPHKGLGVIGFTNRSYMLHDAGALLPWHIPFTVDGLNIIGLWAHVRDKDRKYVRVTPDVVNRHANFLSSAPSLIIGDFISNTVWDREHPGPITTPCW